MPTTVSVSPLLALANEYWEGRMRADPIEATFLGDRRFDADMPDATSAANDQQLSRLEDLLTRLRHIDPTGLSESDRITWAALEGELESDRAIRTCHMGEWAVDPRDGPQVLFFTIAQLQTVVTPEQGRALVARYRKMGLDLDQRLANLRHALGKGRVATRGAVERVLRQLDELLGEAGEKWALLGPATVEHPDWDPVVLRSFQVDVRQAVAETIRPAFDRYRTVLRNEILPQARPDDRVGLSAIPGGVACYQRMIKVHTSLELSADEIHRIGLEEVARIRQELTARGERLWGTHDLVEIQHRLRSDKSLFFHDRDEVENKARQALARAEAAMPRWFGRLPTTPCLVKRIEPYEEKDSTIGYYRQPAVDGSRAGTYYINTYGPETRPRYEAEVLAFHESVPGHHIQIALAQEKTGIPEFRRHAGVTAYVEGWALYTERLADEMGLYSGELDRIGMLSFDAWRASRLVVDTGLHTKGWSRQQAIQFMVDNTALAVNNIENEVDRYIGWPGQALAYKLGQREIFNLRHQAERHFGKTFDIRAFHDLVLEEGAVSLSVLRQKVERWLGVAAK